MPIIPPPLAANKPSYTTLKSSPFTQTFHKQNAIFNIAHRVYYLATNVAVRVIIVSPTVHGPITYMPDVLT